MSKLGVLLVREGLLSESDRKMIRRESGTHRGSFARSILALGVLDEDELAALFSAKTSYRIASKNLADEVNTDVLELIPAHILSWLDVIPLRKSYDVLYVAMTDPTDQEVIGQLEFFSGLTVKPVIAPFSLIHKALRRHLGAMQEFGRSEFEEFLRNHSAQATKFAAASSKRTAARKQKSNASSDDLSNSDEGFHMAEGALAMLASSANDGGFELQSTMESGNDVGDEMIAMDDVTLEQSADDMQVSTELVPEAIDDFSDAGVGADAVDDELVEDGAAAASMATDELQAMETTDDDLSGIAEDAASQTESLSANMDDLLSEGSESLDLAQEHAASEPTLEDADLTVALETPENEAASDLSLSGDATNSDDLLAGDMVETDEASLVNETIGGDDPFASEDVGSLSLDDLEASVVTADGGALDLGAEASADGINTIDSLDSSPAIDSVGRDAEPSLLETGNETAVDDGGVLDVSPQDLDSSHSEDLFAGDIDIAGEPSIGEFAATESAGPDIHIGSQQEDIISLDDAVTTSESLLDGGTLPLDDSLLDAELNDTAALEHSPVASLLADVNQNETDALVGEIHPGIAALNRALVNMALLMDPKKALNRVADAADQVGIASGVVVTCKNGGCQAGVMWSREGDQLGAIHDIPAGLDPVAVAKAAPTIASRENWLSLDDALGAEAAAKFNKTWPGSENAPTHVIAQKQNANYVVAFARFSGQADHDGLKQSFGTLIKAVAPKVG